MSTRAMIGIKMPDGSVQATYLHNDGYVLHAGYTLATFYDTAEKVRTLLNLGELSSIAEAMRDFSASYLYLFDNDRWLYARFLS